MAELNATEREGVRQDWTKLLMSLAETTDLTKADVLAAGNALDTFLNANAATINAAIPLPARSSMTTKQKASLLTIVARRRYGVEV